MTDGDGTDSLAAKHERNREQRIAEIKRWVAYIRDNPPEVWGEQLNTLIESQIEAARESGVSAEQYDRVRRAGEAYSQDDPADSERTDSVDSERNDPADPKRTDLSDSERTDPEE